MLTGTAFQYETGPGLPYTPSRPAEKVLGVEESPERRFTGGVSFLRDQVSNGRYLRPGAHVACDYARSHIYGQMIRVPVTLDAGFIVADTDYELELWNTNKHQVEVLTVTYDPSSYGLNFQVTAAPFFLSAFDSEIATLTILQDGPPTQNTEIIFTVDEEQPDNIQHVFTIQAVRIVSIPFTPNWIDKFRLDFSFETIISTNERFKEQRRPLRNTSKRTSEFVINEQNTNAHRFLNTVQYGKDKIFGAPIFNEVIFPTNALQSDVTINTSTDLTGLWNLNNHCQFVMFLNYVTGFDELKEIFSVGPSSIILADGLLNSFTVSETIILPLYLGYLESINFRAYTGSLDKASIKLREY